MTTKTTTLPGGLQLDLCDAEGNVVHSGVLSLSSPLPGIAHLNWTLGGQPTAVLQCGISDSAGRLTGNRVATSSELVITDGDGKMV